MAAPLILDVVAKKNSKDLSTLADEFDKLRKKVDDSSAGFDKNQKFSALLDKQLAATRDQVKQLGEEFDRTGDKDVFAKLGGAQKNLASLERIRKQLTSALEAGAQDAAPEVGKSITGGKFSTQVRSGIASALKSLPDIPLDADAGPAERRLAELRAQLEALGREHVGVTIDERGALTSLARIKGELLALGGKNSSLRIDTHAAAGDLTKLGGLFEQIGIQGAKSLAKGVEDGADEGFKSLTRIAPASLQGALSTPVIGPVVAVALAGAFAAAAPTVGAALGAGVIAGGGLTLIGAGIASQIGSPRVKSELDKLKTEAKSTFTLAGSAFAPVVLDGLHDVEDEIDKFGPRLHAIETQLAPVADRLFTGITGFVDKLGPGLSALSSAAGPVLGTLADELPGLGKALSDTLKSISGGGPGAAAALHDLLVVIEGVARFTGVMIEGLEKSYEALRVISSAANVTGLANLVGGFEGLSSQQKSAGDSANAASLAFDAVTKAVQDQGAAIPHTAEQFADLASKINQTTDTADTLAGAMSDKIFNSLLAGDQATLQWNESLTRLSQSFADNGRQLDITTAKGQSNREAVLAAVQANIREYDTQIAAGQSATQAAAAYDQNTAALERQLRKAGLTQQQVDGLIGKYKAVPDKVDTSIAIQGLTTAINNLTTLLKQINGIHDKTVTITYKQRTVTPGGGHGSVQYNAKGGVRHAATGLVIPPSNPGTVIAAEPQTGGEVLAPLKGISKQRAMQLAGVIGNSYGFDVVPRGGARTPVYGGAGGGGGGRGTGSRPVVLQVNANGASGLETLFLSWLVNATRGGLLPFQLTQQGG